MDHHTFTPAADIGREVCCINRNNLSIDANFLKVRLYINSSTLELSLNIKNSINTVEAQRETFLLNTALETTGSNAAIERYREQMEYDDEIIRLQESVRQASEAKMANGTLSGTELTRDIHAEQSARQDKIIHEMELLMAIYDLKHATGN